MLVADRTRNHIMTKYLLPLRSKLARRRRLSRLLRVEHLEPRQLLNVDWRNPLDGLDVDNDSFISPLDALVIINDLNANGSRTLPSVKDPTRAFIDPTGDQNVSPLDVLTIINYLNSNIDSRGFLSEQPSLFDSQQGIVITIGQNEGARLYRMQVTADFGSSSSESAVPDLFSVYLVDPSNPSQTLLDRGVNGSSLFSLSQRGTEMATGLVRWPNHQLSPKQREKPADNG